MPEATYGDIGLLPSYKNSWEDLEVLEVGL